MFTKYNKSARRLGDDEQELNIPPQPSDALRYRDSILLR